MQVFAASCSSLKLSCEDVFYEKATWRFSSLTCSFSLLDLFARSAHAKTDKRCFFLHRGCLHNMHTGLSLDRSFSSHNWFNRLKAFSFRKVPCWCFLKSTQFPSKESIFALLSLLTMELQLVASLLTCSTSSHDWNPYKYFFDAVKMCKNLITSQVIGLLCSHDGGCTPCLMLSRAANMLEICVSLL